MIKLKIGLWLLFTALSVLCIFCTFGWFISAGDVGYSFVTITKLVLFGCISLSFAKFDFAGIWRLMTDLPAFGALFLKLGILPAVPFALGALLWLFLNMLFGWILRASANRLTTLHGSSRWATEKELKRAGLLKKTGLVMGQTDDAVFRDRKARPPKRKPGELKSVYENRKATAPTVTTKMVKKGRIVMQNSNSHTLIVGSTRSGKGVSVLIPTLFKWPESVIIFDPKAESWDITANFRSKFSYAFKFQPERPDESIHYNPLLSIRRGENAIADIQNMASILIPDTGSKEPFWDNEARKLLGATIGYVIYCEPPERKTFKFVYSIFSRLDELKAAMDAEKAMSRTVGEEIDAAESEDEDMTQIKQFLSYYANNCKKYMDNTPTMPDDLYSEFRTRHGRPKAERERIEEASKRYLTKADKNALDTIYHHLCEFVNAPDQQLGSVVSSMTTNLQMIADPNVQAITDRSDFTMEDFVHGVADSKGQLHPMSLYLCVSLSSMFRLIPLMRIFYEQALSLLTRNLEKNPYRLLLIFDEFYQMGKMEIVNKALALSAGYGVLCCVAIQSFEQLRKVYESDAMFVDNFAHQVILRVNDPSTCDKIERMLGQTTKKHLRVNTSGNINQLTHRSESYDTQEQGRALMTAEEIRTMDDQTCVIINSGMHAYRGKKIRYYLDDRFTRLYKDGRGNLLPPPAIDDNYPHPESVDGDGRRTGLDNSGWHLLLGWQAAMVDRHTDENERARQEMASGDVIGEQQTDNDFISEYGEEEYSDAGEPAKDIEDNDSINEIDEPLKEMLFNALRINGAEYMREDDPFESADLALRVAAPGTDAGTIQEVETDDDGEGGMLAAMGADADEQFEYSGLTARAMEPYDDRRKY